VTNLPVKMAEANGSATQRPVEALPQFPWPPPPPSGRAEVPYAVLSERIHRSADLKDLHLRDVDAVLKASLMRAGYELSYYRVPDGFALVARIERIEDDGSPYQPARLRFDPESHPLETFSFEGYLSALFFAPPGHYRVIVFVVSSEAFMATGKPVTRQEAIAWQENGASSLPPAVRDLAYSDRYSCMALIYEFEKRDTGTDPVELHPGRLSAAEHLAKSGIARFIWSQSTP
jgi:hypothetical protein